MSSLYNNALNYLRKRFPSASISNREKAIWDRERNEAQKIWVFIVTDLQTEIKQGMLAIENLGDDKKVLDVLGRDLWKFFIEKDELYYLGTGEPSLTDPFKQFASKFIIYTNKLSVPSKYILDAFKEGRIEIIDESTMYKSLFISYGGPDERIVCDINRLIKSKGVKTWFFPDDAEPGSKLHRVMHDGVNKHDRVLLVCSRSSLSRQGVLNEIERVLEREAKEGGIEILIPITLDDFVYSDWAPERVDVANQIRARVITKIETNGQEIESAVRKIIKVLKKV